MRIVKYNLEYRIKVLELAKQGLTLGEIAETLGIATNTLSSWRRKDTKFNDLLLKLRKEAMSNLVEKNIKALANGVETTEITEHDIYKREDGTEIKRTIKRIKHKPDLKANQSISSKYDLGYSEKEVVDEDSKPILNINFSGLSYREVLTELRASPIEATELAEDIE